MSFLDTVGTWFVNLSTGFLGRVFHAVIAAAIGYLVIHLVIGMLTRVLEKSKLEKAAHSLILSMAKVILFVLLALIVASALGIDVTGVVALASVATLAVSLALQNMLGNIVGGFTLLYTHPFKSGDFVEIAGQSGEVKEIGIAYTKLATPDNKLISIPNSAVVGTQIINYTTTGVRRVDIAVSASYDAPISTVLDTLRGAAQTDMTLAEPEAPFAALVAYGESTISYTLRFWVKSEDYWAAMFAVNAKIKAEFDHAGVEMSYPHLNVHLDK